MARAASIPSLGTQRASRNRRLAFADPVAGCGLRADRRERLLCATSCWRDRAAIGLSPEASGLVVTLTQIGYGAGLLLIVPLGDLIENRLLVTSMVGVTCIALAAAACSSNAALFLPSVLLVGVGAVAVQILIPYASHLAPPETRGTLVGNVTSGLMAGVMLSRPASSLIASCVELAIRLSAHRPSSCSFWRSGWLCDCLRGHRKLKSTYPALLASMSTLALSSRVLRQRAIYQCFLYGAFSVFWTTIPLRLTGPAFHFSQGGVALFALLGGGGGILAAPIGGRLADRGWTRWATAGAMIAVAIGFLLTLVPIESSTRAFCLLVVAAIVLDSGMTVNFILGQRSIFVTEAEYRSRLNGLYMAFFFLAGAAGSALGAWAYAAGGWRWVSCLGVGLPVAGLLCWLGETQQLHGGGDGGSGNHGETRQAR